MRKEVPRSRKAESCRPRPPRGESSQTFPSRKIAPLASTTTANARVSAAKRLRFMGILPRLSITNDVDGRLFTIYDPLIINRRALFYKRTQSLQIYHVPFLTVFRRSFGRFEVHRELFEARIVHDETERVFAKRSHSDMRVAIEMRP